jgi:hypothetical protein
MHWAKPLTIGKVEILAVHNSHFFEYPDAAEEDCKYSSVGHPIFIIGCLQPSQDEA